MPDLSRTMSRLPGSSRRRAAARRSPPALRKTPLALLAAAALLQGAPLWAQTGADAISDALDAEGLRAAPTRPDASVAPRTRPPAALPGAVPDAPVLRASPLLRDEIPRDDRRSLPVYVTGDRTVGQTGLTTGVEGDAELRRGDTVIRADKLEYDQPTDRATATGNVRINQAGNQFEGPAADLRVESFEGTFEQPRYKFLQNGAYGEARRVDFIDDENMVIHDATYTTCRRRPGDGWVPDWILTASSITIDQGADTGIAEDAKLRFKSLPAVPLPELSFPLTEKRKSGFLPPVIATGNVNGVETIVPYYWDIAPNRDATLYPSVKTKRGVDLAGEFRYLEDTYRGQVRGNWVPYDTLRERARWGLSAQQTGLFDTGIPGIGALGLAYNINRVSDDDYWRDFSRISPTLMTRTLPTDVNLNWGRNDFSVALRTLKWQTLQDTRTTTAIVPPYDRMPQLTVGYAKLDQAGFDYSVTTDFTRFEANRALTNQPNAKRAFALGQISRPFIAPGGFFTPKLQFHATAYQFDEALPNGMTSASRSVPTASLDTGLVFERDANYFGRSFRQTLEPRAFYVRTPYRDQNYLPVYDTSYSDFNFASIWTENAYIGNDRISDNNLLTLGTTTRLLDADTGAEAARFGIAQRLRFEDQRVTLPGGTVATDRLSDVLLGASVNWTRQWALDSTFQYNPKTDQSIRSVVGARYNPGDYRVVSAAYRRQRVTSTITTPSQLIDVGWQWPINDLWGDRGLDLGAGRGQGPGRIYSVGRMNYNIDDSKLVNMVAGFEYEGDCWIGRIVVQRQQTSTTTANKSVLFQIEFLGFSRVGSNPLVVLRQNIPRYQYLRDQVTSPSRFSNYD
jgi:LPS-assembly protein